MIHLAFYQEVAHMLSCSRSCEDIGGCMTCHIDCFRPKLIRDLVFIKHCSCGFYESSILPLNNSILLRCVWYQEFMTNSFFIKIFFYVGVLELGAIVASYSLDLGFKLILGSFCKFLEGFLYYTFVMQKEYPSETRIIINNDKTIFVTTNAYINHRPEEIHMKKFKWLDGGDDAL